MYHEISSCITLIEVLLNFIINFLLLPVCRSVIGISESDHGLVLTVACLRALANTSICPNNATRSVLRLISLT